MQKGCRFAICAVRDKCARIHVKQVVELREGASRAITRLSANIIPLVGGSEGSDHMNKARIAVWAACLLIAGILGAWTFHITSAPQAVVSDGPFGVPFTLVSQKGQPITEQAFRGKPTALFFGYTHCPDVCPTTLFELNGWMQTVDPDGSKLNAYFITIDPDRDTPEIMNQYVSNVSQRITGISGPPAKVEDMAKGFRVYFKKVPTDDKDPNGDYTMDHTASVFLLDSDGRFAGTIAYQEDPDVAVKKLQNLIKRG
jgi:protein SCO1/2